MTKEQRQVLLGAALYQISLLGIWINVTGVYLAEIRIELGLTVTSISAYYTTKNLAAAALGAVIAKIFFQSDQKRFMAIVAFSVTVSAMLLIGAGSPVLWYGSALVCSLTQGSSAVMVPYILNQWFQKRAGRATGIAMGVSGLASAVTSRLSSGMIQAFGWRVSLLILCVSIWILAALGIFLMFRNTPPIMPCAADEGGSSDLNPVLPRSDRHPAGREHFRWDTFLPCCVIFVSATSLMQFTQYFSIYATNAGYALQLGATLTSLNMIGNTAGKFLFGFLEDAIGVWSTILLAFVCILAACICYIGFPGSPPLLCAGALLYGVVYALVNVSLSRGSIAAYGAEQSQQYVGLHVSINNICGAVYAMLIGILFDRSQSFTVILSVGALLCLASVLAARRLSGQSGKSARMVRSG